MSQNLMDPTIPLVPIKLEGSSDFSVPLVPVNSGGSSDEEQSKSGKLFNVSDSVTSPECPRVQECCCHLLGVRTQTLLRKQELLFEAQTEKVLQEQQKIFGVLTEKISALQEQLSVMSESRSSVYIAEPSIPSQSPSLSSEDETFFVNSRNKLNQSSVTSFRNSSPSQYRSEQCSWCGAHRHTKENCRRWLGLCFRCGSSSHWLTHCPLPQSHAGKSKAKKSMSASFELGKSVKPKSSKNVDPRSDKSESTAKSPPCSVVIALPDRRDVNPPACQETVTQSMNIPCLDPTNDDVSVSSQCMSKSDSSANHLPDLNKNKPLSTLDIISHNVSSVATDTDSLDDRISCYLNKFNSQPSSTDPARKCSQDPSTEKTGNDEIVTCESVDSGISVDVVDETIDEPGPVNSSISELPNTSTPYISSCYAAVTIAKENSKLKDLFAEISRREQEFGCSVKGCKLAGTAYCAECSKHYYRISVVCSPRCLEKFEENEKKLHSDYKDRLVPCKDNCMDGECPSCSLNVIKLCNEFRDRRKRYCELEQLRKKFLELSGKL